MKAYKVIALGVLLNDEYDISKIEQSFKKFSCQREVDLENFLINKAVTYERANIGKTYLLIDLRNCRKIKSPFILTNYNISITMYLSHSGG